MADIVDTAIAAGAFSILAKAVKLVGLVGIINGSGPFTVFARTHEAFGDPHIPRCAGQGAGQGRGRAECEADFEASNGVIRVIDTVLIPA